MSTKERILHTAIKLFSQHSAKDVSLQNLADQMEMQKAAIYYYFKTKADLMNAIIAYASESISIAVPTKDAIKAQLETTSPRQLLIKYTRYENDRDDYKDLLRVLYRLSFYNQVPHIIYDFFVRFRSVVFHVLKYMRDLGAIPNGDIITLSTMWTHATLTYSILFTHSYVAYNDYCNTINLYINIAVNGISSIESNPIKLPVYEDRPLELPKTTRGIIAYHALHLFCSNGYEKTTMREIAERSGIQVSSIYKHYENKKAMLWEIMCIAKSDHYAHTETFDSFIGNKRIKKDPTILIEALASSFIPILGPNAKPCYRLLLVEQYRDVQVKDFYIGRLLEDCVKVETVLDVLVSQNIIPPCSSCQIARAHIFNHCALSIQSVLLGRNINRSQGYRIKAATILVSAILDGENWN